MLIPGELIMSIYVAESITIDAGRFGHVGLCQLRTKLKTQQCETSYIANADQWYYELVHGCDWLKVTDVCLAKVGNK